MTNLPNNAFKLFGYVGLVAISILLLWILPKPHHANTKKYVSHVGQIPKKKSPLKSVPTKKAVIPSKKKNKAVVITDTGSKSDLATAKKILKNFKAKHQSNLKNKALRKDVTIRYYYKENDDSVAFQIADYGFYIHERQTAKQFSHYKSNAVFYGDSVTLEDLKAVCFVLSLGGLPLQTIELSKYHSGWKAKSIEIGTDTTVMNNPKLTIGDIIDLEFSN